MANVGIIGYGVVGKAVEYGFKGRHEVRVYDKYLPSSPLEEVVAKSDVIFVTLPTPCKGNKIDLSIMDDNLEQISQLAHGSDKTIIIKSTVIPGTTAAYAAKYPDLKFCFNPEFLTEANPLQDFLNPDRLVMGSNDESDALRVAALYRGVLPSAPILFSDPTSAEMTKYMANALLATKVIFANEVYDLCQKLGVDYEAVKRIVSLDERVGKSHLNVTPERGFGGKCLPKDLVALIGLYQDLEVDASILESVWDKNLRIRKVYDWEDIPFVKSDSRSGLITPANVTMPRVHVAGSNGYTMGAQHANPRGISAEELSAYAIDSWLATERAFAIEMYEMCQKLGIDYTTVKNMVIADKRIPSGGLDIPHITRGSIKNLDSMLELFHNLNVDSSLLSSVQSKDSTPKNSEQILLSAD